MEKRKKIKLVNVTAFVLALLIFFTGLCSVVYFIGGKGIFNMKGLEYPDYPAANVNPEIDSWTQWKSYDDNVIEIDWFVDDTAAAFPDQNSMIYKRILEKTGVKINFKKATSGDGTEIATKIAGNNLPDVVSIKANTTLKNELAKEQTCYPIQELASRWAPSLLKRLREDEEMVSYYEYSDGYIYGIPNNFYMTKDVETYGESGRSLVPTGAALARKDYLDAYHAYRREADPDFDEAEVATPQGMLDFLLWVKETYHLSNSNPTVNISAFEKDRTHGSLGMRWLMEYFSVPEENADGEYVYQQAQDEFVEMMAWLNELYRANLLTEGSLGANASTVGQYLQNGDIALFVGSTVNYATQLKNWELNISGKNPIGEEARYVPIIFSNSAGTTPQLAITGNSYMYTMISANCKRPDRVIKLFDYLYSDEGQELVCYGIEDTEEQAGSFVYAKRPGATETLANGKTYTYKYGQIEYSAAAKAAWNSGNVNSYGFYQMTLFYKPMYMYLSSASGGQFNNYRDYVKYNSKAAIIPYAYSYRGFEFELDSSDKRYTELYTVEATLRNKWFQKYTGIIGSDSSETVEKEIRKMLVWCESVGLDDYIAFKNECFQAHKKKMGIAYASPINDPKNTAYKNLTISSVYGDTSRYLQVPEEIARN